MDKGEYTRKHSEYRTALSFLRNLNDTSIIAPLDSIEKYVDMLDEMIEVIDPNQFEKDLEKKERYYQMLRTLEDKIGISLKDFKFEEGDRNIIVRGVPCKYHRLFQFNGGRYDKREDYWTFSKREL